jgi:O-antigen/teichoic acid export membrane protein
LDWSYLFRAYTFEALSTPFRVALYGFCVLAIVLAILAQRQLAKNPGYKKSFYKKLIGFGWTSSIVGLLFILFRETRAMYLGSRFWLLLWAIGVLVWAIYLLFYYLITIPKIKKKKEENAEFSKWLPKAKK